MKKKNSIKTKQQQNIANNTSIQDLISHLNDGKWQTLIMMQLNVVHVDKGKILFWNNFHIIHIISNRLCYSQRYEYVYKTLMMQRLTFCH